MTKLTKNIIVACIFMLAFSGLSQEFNNFEVRYQDNIKGDLTFISNQILNRDGGTHTTRPEDGYNNVNNNGSFWPASNRDLETGGRYNYNDYKQMQYINVDPGGGRFSSSTANLSFPNMDCNRIRYAGLYWAATYPSATANGSFDGVTYVANTVPVGTGRQNDFNQIQFRVPGGAYQNITADEILFDGFTSTDPTVQQNSPYACYADVTALLAPLANPAGDYTVANMRATTGGLTPGGGTTGGWTLVIVYENPTLTGKLITTFDGFARVRDTDQVDINYNGFTTIPTGQVNANIGAATLEGDFRITGDRMRIRAASNGAFTTMSNASNPANNFFNSNITLNGVDLPGRNPSSLNTLGFDTDIFALNNFANSVIPNNETAATFRFETNGDQYYPFFNSFNIEIIEPEIVLEKRVEDIAGNDITGLGVNLGQTLDYVLSFQNLGNDDGTNYTIRDILPVNVTLDESNIVMPLGATYTFDPPSRTVTFTIPDYLIEVGDPTYSIRMRVNVAENCFDFIDACTELIQNLAYSTYQGVQNNNQITDDPSITDFNACGFIIPGATNFLLDDLDDCNFTRTVQLCGDNVLLDAGNNFDSYFWVRDANENGLIDATDPVLQNGTSDTLLVTEEGTYIVDKIIPDPCKGFMEIMVVERFGSNATNPIIDHMNTVNGDGDLTNDIQGEIVTCGIDGDLLPRIFLCGTNDAQILQTNITDAQSISWELLDENSCTAAPTDCANKNLSCTWNQIATGSSYTANSAGKYRLVVEYQNGCFNRFYFDVFQNNLNIEYNTRDIVCTTDGYINITNIGSNYGFQLIDITNNSIVVPFSANNGPNFNISSNGQYRVDVVQLNSSGNPIANACVFSTPDIGIRDRNFQVDITTTPVNCNAQGSIQVDILNVEPNYTYRLRQSDGTLIDDETAQPDNTHTFNVNEGNYIIEVATDDGCTFSENVVVSRTPDPTVSAILTQDIGCSAGIITMTASDGFPNPDYGFAIWSKDGVNLYTSVSDIPGSAYQVENEFTFGWRDTDFDNVDEYFTGEHGTYEFIVVDANGCYAFSNAVTIADNGAMTVSITEDNLISCGGLNDAEITLVPSGGIAPFTFSIDGGATTQTTPSFVNLSAGTYPIYVTDSSGCTVDFEHIISDPTPITAEAIQTQVYTCNELGEITIGSVTATSGGSGNYQYSLDGATWTTSTTGGHTFIDLTQGTYSIRVRDANATNCFITLPDIIINPLPTAPIASTQVSYNCDGSGTITVLPSNPSYLYTLDSGTAQTNNVFTNVAPGNYTVSIDYGSDCSIDIPVIVTSGNAFSTNLINSTNPTCTGLSNGTITFEVENFDTTAGFEYSTDGGSTYTSSTTSPVTTGAIYGDGTQTILIRKTDDINCTSSVTTTIIEPSTVIASASITTPISCTNGGATITASATGGLPNYEYQLERTNGNVITAYQTAPNFTGLASGDYIVRVRDSNSCDDEIDAVITVNTLNTIDFDLTATNCYSGNNDATIQVNVTDGNGDYTFSINGGPWVSPTPNTATNYTFENLSSGNYTINVRDGSGCVGTVQNVEIDEAITLSASAPNIAACSNSTYITIVASGGDGSFQYAVMPDGDSPNISDYDASQVREVFAPGDYDIYLRDPSGGPNRCSAFTEITISEDAPLSLNITNTPVGCSGDATATMTLNITGGSGPYRYSINDGTSYQTTNQFINLPAGSYDVRVQDVNNCEIDQIYVISEPFNLSASAGVTEVVECNPNEEAEVRITNAIGGTLPYEYSFDGGATFQASNIDYLPPGTHDLLIRDASLCTFPMSVTVADGLPQIDFTTGLVYDCDGEATVTVTPSILTGFDFDYEINSVPNTPSASNIFSDVPVGTHTITINYVADTPPNAGDLLFDSFGSGVNRPTSEIDPVYCYEPQNGSPSSCPGFGTDTHIQDGEYSVTSDIVNPYGIWRSPNDHTNPSDPNGRFLAINVGGVAGVNGIIYAKRNVEVLPNRAITISLEAFNLLRQGSSGGDPSIVVELVNGSGTVIASTSSGNIPKNNNADDWHNFTVDLNPGAETNLDIVIRTNSAVTLGNDIAIDDIQAFQIPQVCPQSRDVTVVVEAGNEFNASITATNDISCNGLSDGEITFEVENFDAVNGYEYSVNSGPFSGLQLTPTFTITGLSPGANDVVIRDINDNSCSVIISQNIDEPDTIEASASITAPFTCNVAGATITASAIGGTPAYQYQLEDTLGSIITAYQTTPTFNNVTAGNYNIRVIDVNGCDDLINVPISINAPSDPSFTVIGTDCYTGNNDGSIFVDVTSLPGNGGFQFSINAGPWITPTPSSATNYTFSNLSPGTYSINVLDQFGCVGTPQNVTINSQLVVSSALTNDLSCSAPASITLNATGGSGTYSYEWSDDAGVSYSSANFVGNVFSTTVAGSYTFRISDTTTPAPCSFVTLPITVTPAPQPVITSVTPTNVLCNGASTGALDVVIDTSIGTPLYTIEVLETNTSTNYGTQTNGLPAGNYEIRITDDKDCVSDPFSVVITQPDVITYDINLIPITCNATSGTNPGSIGVENLAGGTAEYSYYLTGNNGYSDSYTTTSGGENHTFTILEFGIYEVDVVDANGCSVRTTNIIASPPDDLDIDISAATLDCTTGGTAIVSVSTAILGTNYEFGILDSFALPYASTYFPPDVPAGPTHTFTGLVPGITYTFVVHDITTDCYYFETAAAPINSPSSMTATLDAVTNITCTGATDGNVTFTISGYDSSATDVAYEIFNAQSNVTTGMAGTSGVNPPGGAVTISNFGALPEGVYYILLSEIGGSFNGCSVGSANFTIDAASVLLDVTATATINDNCNTNAGVITASAQHGQAPYEFQYLLATDPAPTTSSTGWTTATSANVESGNYIVYAKDSYGCIQNDPVTVLLDTNPEISLSIIDECADEGNYQVVVNLDSPSTTPYALSVNGAAFQNIIFNGSGEYTIGGLTSGTNQSVEIRDLNGCGETELFDIYPNIEFSANLTKELTCDVPPAHNAEITIEVTTGSGNYDIEISNGLGTTLTRTALPSNPYTYLTSVPEDYTITIYDNNVPDSCSRQSMVQVAPATEPVIFETHTDVTCFGADDGSITMTYNDNGISPLTYSISPSAGTFNAATATFENLPPDTYSITATGINNCTTTITDIIIDTPLQIAMTAPTVIEFACSLGNSNDNARIEINTSSISGGSGNYVRYEFINDQATAATTDDVVVQDGTNNIYTETNFAGGSYIINVYDDNGCIGSTTATILPYDELLSGNIVVDEPISCSNAGEDITINATGSISNSGSNPANYEFRELPSGAFQASGAFLDLAIGTHVFEIRNVNTGCLITATHIVSDPNTFDLVVDKLQDVICFGTETGEVTLELVDATYVGPFDWIIYDDNGTATDRSDDTIYKSGNNATNGPTPAITLVAGGYIAEVTQVNFPECVNIEAFTISGPNSGITANRAITEITCAGNDGVIEITDVTGGWGGYRYYVGTTPPTITDYSTSTRFDALAPGTYQAWVLDQNGCPQEVQSGIILDNPTPISATLQLNQPNCPNFSGELEVINTTGGQGSNYTYQLIKDGTPVGTPQNTTVFSGLDAGSYTVEINDQWSCTFTTSALIMYEPITPVATIVKTIDCTPDPGGQITITQTGGSGNFDYEVRYPGTLATDPADNTNTTGVFTTLTLVGDYTFTIIDQASGHACPVTITQNLQDRVLPVLNIDSFTNVSCNSANDGNITVSVIDNGVAPYTFTIISGPGSSATFPIAATSSTNTSAVFEALEGTATGITYTIEARGVNNCFVTETQIITQPEVITIAAPTVVEFACSSGNNTNNATITAAIPSGGSGNYPRYEFINDQGTAVTTDDIVLQNGTNNIYTETNFAGGSYTINVYDDNGCIGSQTATILPFVQLSSPTVTVNPDVTCNPGNDAEIQVGLTITPSGATPNLEYLVDGADNAYNQTNATGLFTGLGVGNYLVSITNLDTGCIIQTTHEILDPDVIEVVATKLTDEECINNGIDEGSFEITIDNYTGNYSYQLYDVNNNPVAGAGYAGTSNTSVPLIISNLPGGTYYVRIIETDAPYCQDDSNEIAILAPELPVSVIVIEQASPSCTNDQGSILVNPEGGVAPYTIVLTNTTTNQSETETNVNSFVFSGLSGGDFTIQVTDSQSCPITENISLVRPDNFTPTISTTPLVCFNGNTGTVYTTVPSGRNVAATYLYQLNIYDETGTNIVTTSAAQSSVTFSGLNAGFYSITTSDNLGCSFTSAIEEIENPAEVAAQLIRTRALTCDTTIMGVELQLSATGGLSGSYEYSTDNVSWFAMTGNSVNLPLSGILLDGTYQYYVRDAVNGCTAVLSNEIAEDSIEPLELIVDTSTAFINCNGDETAAIYATADGGLGNYIYELFTDSSLSIASRVAGPQSNGNFNFLPADTYYVAVTSEDCTTNYQEVVITEPPILEHTDDVQHVLCYGEANGSITVNLSGGSGGYQYAISPNLNQFDSNNVFEGLTAGNYTIIAQDQNGCFLELPYTIEEPDPLTATAVATPEICVGEENGIIELTIIGGTAPYSTRLSSENNFVQNRATITDLSAGGYIIFIRDANDCETDISVTVDSGVDLSATVEPIYECSDTIPENYVNITLHDPSTLGDVLYAIDSTDPDDMQLNPDFRNSAPGQHYIAIAHSNGCVQTIDFEIEDFEPLTLNVGQINLNEITASAEGGLEDYTFFFNDVNNGTDNTYRINQSGTYQVRVIDQNGCEVISSIEMEFVDIEIPEFFTPDGDGLNDFWVPGNREAFPEILTIIFDRYGREVYRLGLNDPGWNGMYKGSKLPTGDYWYVIKLQGENDEREFVGHFTLYR